MLVGEIIVSIIFSEGATEEKVNGVPLALALAETTTAMYYRSKSVSNLFWSLFFGERVATINFTSKDRELESSMIEIKKIVNEIL